MPGYKSIITFLYSLLLPLFFCLHGWYESYSLISLTDFIQAFFIISSISLIIYVTFYFLIPVRDHVELATLLSMGMILFFPFGLQDDISVIELTNPVSSIVIISIFILCFFLFFRYSKKTYSKLTIYTRRILTVLVIIDACILLMSLVNEPPIQPEPFIKKSDARQVMKQMPSVYIILLDEYAGNETLMKHASFNNEAFLSDLKNMGFHVVNNPRSNYNHTILSMSSFLNADYNSFANRKSDKNFYKQSLVRIENNRATATFSELGYEIKNFSPFNLNNHKRFYKSFSIPSGSEIIISPTILDDIYNNWLFFITRRLPDKSRFENLVSRKTIFNKVILDSILEYSVTNKKPSFCFAHLNMPHAIYARDSTGRINTSFLTKQNITVADRTNAYLQYLAYTNKFVLPYLQQLKRNTNNSDIIILMSDHGFRDFKVDDINTPSFNNILAVYSPGLLKTKWQEGFSNVNIFRTVFSEISGVDIPLLKDSTFSEFIRK